MFVSPESISSYDIQNYPFLADTKPESMRNRVSLISVGDGRDIEDIQESFTRLAELCIPNPFRFKVRFIDPTNFCPMNFNYSLEVTKFKT